MPTPSTALPDSGFDPGFRGQPVPNHKLFLVAPRERGDTADHRIERDGLSIEKPPEGWHSHVRPTNHNPYLFHTGRVPPVIEAALLIVRAGGLVATAMYPITGPVETPVRRRGSGLRLILAVLGATLFMWLAGHDVEGRWWVRDQTRAQRR